jgi:hypothetical protein
MRLVVIDFAGTLSLKTVLFGREESLAAELKKSGIAGLGIGSPGLFWEKIILPGWEEGSLTGRGCAAVIAERLFAFTRASGNPAPPAAIHAAAGSFTRSYFTHSPIEHAWRETLTRLAAAPDALTLIATDHYAEASAHIRGLLSRWDIDARPLLPPASGEGSAAPAEAFALPEAAAGKAARVFVANSADLGARKADAAFWETVKAGLEKELSGHIRLSAVRVADDFGFNETAGDSYGGMFKAFSRRGETAARIKNAFGIRPGVFSYFLPPRALASGGRGPRQTYGGLVRRAAAFLEETL